MKGQSVATGFSKISLFPQPSLPLTVDVFSQLCINYYTASMNSLHTVCRCDSLWKASTSHIYPKSCQGEHKIFPLLSHTYNTLNICFVQCIKYGNLLTTHWHSDCFHYLWTTEKADQYPDMPWTKNFTHTLLYPLWTLNCHSEKTHVHLNRHSFGTFVFMFSLYRVSVRLILYKVTQCTLPQRVPPVAWKTMGVFTLFWFLLGHLLSPPLLSFLPLHITLTTHFHVLVHPFNWCEFFYFTSFKNTGFM